MSVIVNEPKLTGLPEVVAAPGGKLLSSAVAPGKTPPLPGLKPAPVTISPRIPPLPDVVSTRSMPSFSFDFKSHEYGLRKLWAARYGAYSPGSLSNSFTNNIESAMGRPYLFAALSSSVAPGNDANVP